MGIYDSFKISGSGLTAERLRLQLISNNIANMSSTRTGRGGPYRKQVPIFAERLQKTMGTGGKRTNQGQGVEVKAIVEDGREPKMVYDPDHPEAGEDGYVAYPNIEVADEMVNMITAVRAYGANVTALDAAKDIIGRALEIGRS